MGMIEFLVRAGFSNSRIAPSVWYLDGEENDGYEVHFDGDNVTASYWSAYADTPRFWDGSREDVAGLRDFLGM